MEQAVAERPFTHENHAGPPQSWHNDTLNNKDTHHVQHPSWSRDSRRWTSSGSFNEDVREDKGDPPVCRDNLRGACSRGLSCKFQHSNVADHGGVKFCGNDQQKSRLVADPRNNESKDFDSSRRSFFGERREPCRNFRSGRCYRGTTCAYLHLTFAEPERPIHDWNAEQPRGVVMDSRNSRFHEGYVDNNLQISQDRLHGVVTDTRNSRFHDINGDNNLRTSQVHDVASKENNSRASFSREPQNKSPCHNFLRGSCKFGASCRRLHPVHPFMPNLSVDQQPRMSWKSQNHGFADGSHHHVNFRSGSISGEPRSRSPCQYLRGGNCYKGEPSGNLQPVACYERTRYDLGAPHHQAVASTTRDLSFDRVNGVREVNGRGALPYQDPHAGCNISLNDNREAKYVGSSSWSSERKRSRPASDQIQPEFCLKFTKGRCDQGEHCRYLHSFHEYASSVSQRSQKPHLEEANEGLRKCAETLLLAHDTCRDGQMQSNKSELTESNLDKSLGKETKGIICRNPTDGNENVSLWSPPFKRQRTWSRPSFGPEDSFRYRASRQDYAPVRSRCYHEARTQYPDCRSFQFIGPANHVNNGEHLKFAATSVNPSLHMGINSFVMAPNGHGNVTSCESQFDKCLSSSALSETAVLSKKNEVEGATNALQSNQADQKAMELVKECITAGISKGATVINKEPVESDSTRSFEKHHNCEANMAAVVLKADLNHPELLNNKTEDTEELFNVQKTFVESSSAVTRDFENRALPGSEPSDAAILKSSRKLLVLDVNGLLADIVADFPDRCKPDATVAGKGVFKRPFCDDFLQFCFEKFDVGIWSSRTQKNVTRVLDCLMESTKNKLLFCWDQTHCTQTGYNTVENKEKPLVLKELNKLWDKQEKDLPWHKGFYDETNTILLDDSPYKALRNPAYTAIFPSPYTFKQTKDNSLGPDGDLRLYLERLAEAENVQKFIQENPFGQRPITKTNLSWTFYSKIAGEHATPSKEDVSSIADSS